MRYHRLVQLFSLVVLVCVRADTLRSAGSCYNVLEFYRTNALKRVNSYGLRPHLYFPRRIGRRFIDNPCEPIYSRRNAGGLPLPQAAGEPASGGSVAESGAQVATARGAGGGGANNGQVAGVDFSGTNVQIEGVDEPDIIKTDGNRIFVVQGKDFFVVKVEPGAMRGSVVGKITLPLYAREMLFEKNDILVIAEDYGQLVTRKKCTGSTCGRSSGGASEDRGDLATASFIRRPAFFGQSITVVFKLRISGNTPKLISTLRMEGQYISSREVSGSARIVLSTNRANSIRFDRKCDTAAEAIARHKRTINSLSVNDWVPRFTVTGNCRWRCVHIPRALSSCSSIYLPTKDFTGFGLLSVVVLPLSGDLYPRGAVSIASEGRTVFSTASTLYVTATKYRYDFDDDSIAIGSGFTTSLHKFALRSTGARYVASGSVLGSVLNQFSMHEYLDTFFVATTEGARWWRRRNLSKSKVTSFRVAGHKLEKVGEVGNLGVGERIFSVRYVGDQGYVVTFRQVDPLYVIDLSDPYKLRVTGELKIPGFSSYLHPLEAGRILGVGRDATPEGRVTGAKVSLFDVSNVNLPREVASWTLKGSFTTAQFDHRAFLYWKPKSLLVLPINVYSRTVSERFRGSVVLKITQTGIVEQGRISHGVAGSPSAPAIRRNLVLGKENIWSFAWKTLQVNDITSLGVKSVINLN